jgi:uncharacterized repeat protein (TIGR02543 family)
MSVYAQPNWTPVNYTNSTTAYGIVTINSIPAVSSDKVGAFVGSECRAVGNVTINSGTAYVSLVIQGEQVETASFKVWQASTNTIINVVFTIQTNPGSVIGSPPNYLAIAAASTNNTLDVTPDYRLVNSFDGITTFSVSNSGGGTMNWTAVSNSNWLTITSGSSGINVGFITVGYTANNTGVPRIGEIIITAGGATGSPKMVEVRQVAATTQYTVTTSSNPSTGGTTTGGGTYNSSNSVTVTATPNSGYTFTNWTENGTVVSTNASYTFTISGNRTLEANFTAIRYTLTTSSNPANGGWTTGGGTYIFGQSVTITAAPNNGYNFVNWTEGNNVVSPSPYHNLYIDGNRTFVANFAIITYTLTITSVNGTVTKNPDQANYNQGSAVQLTATPSTGYTFTGWSGDATGSTNPLTVTMNSDKNITANFTINTYTLTLNATNGTVAKNPDRANYNYGSTVQLTATPSTGYIFTGWNGDATGSTNPLTVTMNSDKNITANFTIIPVLIVSPDFRSVPFTSGTTTFAVSNTTSGTINWIAFSYASWVTITSGNSGTNSGIINVSYEANIDAARVAVITVNTTGTAGSTKNVEVRQTQYTDVWDLDIGIPVTFNLSQNYPNPFNPNTKIRYGLSKEGFVKITVYDFIGKETAILVNGLQSVGYHEVDFNASNLPSGVYFYQLRAGNFILTKKLVLLK